ncbi:MAG: hypothetical protein LDL41_17185 [Coleofasciculus sp. S288]|nr:hypothetical protein [Coleofasciculus sp. S288]
MLTLLAYPGFDTLCVAWRSQNIVLTLYPCISEIIQSELKFLSELSELTDDERFKQSIAEVIYSLNDLSDTVNLQRRYLNPRA